MTDVTPDDLARFRERTLALQREVARAVGAEAEAKERHRQATQERKRAEAALKSHIEAEARPLPLLEWREGQGDD